MGACRPQALVAARQRRRLVSERRGYDRPQSPRPEPPEYVQEGVLGCAWSNLRLSQGAVCCAGEASQVVNHLLLLRSMVEAKGCLSLRVTKKRIHGRVVRDPGFVRVLLLA